MTVKDMKEYLDSFKETDLIRVMKVLSAEEVKRLPMGTVVFMVNEKTGSVGRYWIVKSGRKKTIRGILGTYEIKDLEGWHYEIEEEQKDG